MLRQFITRSISKFTLIVLKKILFKPWDVVSIKNGGWWNSFREWEEGNEWQAVTKHLVKLSPIITWGRQCKVRALGEHIGKEHVNIIS